MKHWVKHKVVITKINKGKRKKGKKLKQHNLAKQLGKTS